MPQGFQAENFGPPGRVISRWARRKTGRADAPSVRDAAALRHANLACYPAINVPNGFLKTGSPTNVVFYGRPFGEMDVIALAKAYQDAAGFYVKKPAALDT